MTAGVVIINENQYFYVFWKDIRTSCPTPFPVFTYQFINYPQNNLRIFHTVVFGWGLTDLAAKIDAIYHANFNKCLFIIMIPRSVYSSKFRQIFLYLSLLS